MTHAIEIGTDAIHVNCGCTHPDLGEDNCCPIRSGSCHKCSWGVTECTIEDFFKLYEAYVTLKNSVSSKES